MILKELHPWDVTVEEAKDIQRRLASQVSLANDTPREVNYVAGVDISPPDSQGIATGAVVVLAFPALEVREVKLSHAKPGMPYIPGLLSFREVPVLVGALEALTLTPDIILVDGQGYAHPRRFGIACHLGLLTDIPSIGCAKSILRGHHGPLDEEEGAQAPLVDGEEVIGLALRTRKDVAPIYVSIGHKIALESAAHWVMACCQGRRIPEPTRLAHQAAAGRLRPYDGPTGEASKRIQARISI